MSPSAWQRPANSAAAPAARSRTGARSPRVGLQGLEDPPVALVKRAPEGDGVDERLGGRLGAVREQGVGGVPEHGDAVARPAGQRPVVADEHRRRLVERAADGVAQLGKVILEGPTQVIGPGAGPDDDPDPAGRAGPGVQDRGGEDAEHRFPGEGRRRCRVHHERGAQRFPVAEQ